MCLTYKNANESMNWLCLFLFLFGYKPWFCISQVDQGELSPFSNMDYIKVMRFLWSSFAAVPPIQLLDLDMSGWVVQRHLSAPRLPQRREALLLFTRLLPPLSSLRLWWRQDLWRVWKVFASWTTGLPLQPSFSGAVFTQFLSSFFV